MLVIPAGGNSGYNLQRSLRFRASVGAYLSRTPSIVGNRTTWTWSGWIKRGAINGTYQMLFGSIPSGSAYTLLGFNNDESIVLWEYPSQPSNFVFKTNAKYRDPSTHMHIILAYDTTQAVAANRFRLYINGSEVTSFSVDTRSVVAQNTLGSVNYGGYAHIMSSENPTTNNYFFDGVMSEVNFIDGQALTPSSFGEFDSITGVWKPKRYTGTYGTNGFYLNFNDNSALTTSSNVGLGKDFSGNGNYWVTNNISITAGATYDSFMDVPTLTSSAASNFCTLNPLQKGLDTGAVDVLSDGNLHFFSDTTISNYRTWYNTIQPPSGTYYFEVYLYAIGSADTGSQCINFGGQRFYQNGTKTGGVAYGSAWANTNVLGFVVSPTGTWVHINGVWQGSATLSEINAGTLTHSIGAPTFPLEIICGDSSATSDSYVNGAINFGQQPWAYPTQVPSAAVGINTFNLPDPTIKAGNKYFDTNIWAGNGGSQTITNTSGFAPDLVWSKSRTDTNWNLLNDTTRGGNVQLYSNSINAETAASGTIAFNSNGFGLLGYDINNKLGNNYVAWQWKKGATPGFDIVTYTGNGSTQNVNHSLGVAPKFMLVKGRSAVTNWPAWHTGIANTENLYLNLTNAKATSVAWNNTTPTSSQFSVGGFGDTNNNGTTYVAYLWSEIAGFSKFGSYTGNGGADGPFVYCGFRPRYVMIKRTSAGANWYLLDTARNPSNVGDSLLFADSTSTTITSATLDILSNGFKLRNTSVDYNGSGDTYIFAAFAENPSKYALAR